jgi:hypothetical protein
MNERSFWENVRVLGDHECWPWLRYTNKDGYGVCYFKGRNWLAHRIAYLLRVGNPGRLRVCHTCDNPPCCNPACLFLGTHEDNMADRAKKGRNSVSRGAKNGQARLTDDAVLEIRRRVSLGERQRVLREEFRISAATVSRIVLGQGWTHLL